MQLGGLSSTADLGIEAQPAPPPPQQQCRGGAASPSSQELPPAAPPSRQDSSSAAIAAPPSRLACQLGAVLGLQADCCRRAGDAERAEALYQTSAETLRPLALADAEVRPRQLGVCVPASAETLRPHALADAEVRPRQLGWGVPSVQVGAAGFSVNARDFTFLP